MTTTESQTHDVNYREHNLTNDNSHRNEPRRKLVVRLLPTPGVGMMETASAAAADLIKRGCDVFTLDCRSMEEAPPPAEIRAKYAAQLGLPPAPMPVNAAEYGEVDPANPPLIDGDGKHETKIAEVLRVIIAASDKLLAATEASVKDDGTTLASLYNALEAGRQAVDDARDEDHCFASCCDDCHRLYHAVERLVRTWDAFELIAEVPSLADPAQCVWEDALHAAAEILWMTTGQNAA